VGATVELDELVELDGVPPAAQFPRSPGWPGAVLSDDETVLGSSRGYLHHLANRHASTMVSMLALV
jgi:hypothetical protein